MINRAPANLQSAFAPAKVNLYLHVGPVGAAGFHPLDSLVVFADHRAADRVSAKSFPQLRLLLEGEGAKALKKERNNLTIAAAQTLRDACGRGGLGAELTLLKELPVAGGVGGGSSDAAATLKVLNSLWAVNFGEVALENVAQSLGSDVPACVRARPVVMRGRGERLRDVATPDFHAVLVNPGVKLETGKVFARFDQKPSLTPFHEIEPPPLQDMGYFARALANNYRNDLQAPAISLVSEIGRVIDVISQEQGCLLARMSGSGPTCFGLFETADQAGAAADAIAHRKRRYWVRATTLRAGSPAATA